MTHEQAADVGESPPQNTYPPEELTDCGELLQSVWEGIPMRPEDCPAVKRLRDEEGA